MTEDLPRLLVLAQGYPSKQSLMSGVYHRAPLRLAIEAGFSVTLVAPVPWVPPFLRNRNPRWALYDSLPYMEKDGALQVYRPRYFATPDENRRGFPWLTQYVAVRRLLERIEFPQPNVIHSFFGLPNGFVARWLARRWNISYTVSLLGDDVTRYPYFHRINRMLFGKVCRDSAFVCSNSPPLASEAMTLTGTKVIPLSIGVDFSVWRRTATKEEARSRLGLPADCFILLYAGALIEAKGLNDLRQALKNGSFSNFLLVAIGNGPLREQMAGDNSVLCPGEKTQDELRLYMMAADAIILPSHREGLGMVLVEANALGLPALGTDTGGIGDLLKDERGYLFPPKSPTAISKAITEAMSDSAERARRAEKLSEYSHAIHDIETNTGQLIGVWRELATAASVGQNKPA